MPLEIDQYEEFTLGGKDLLAISADTWNDIQRELGLCTEFSITEMDGRTTVVITKSADSLEKIRFVLNAAEPAGSQTWVDWNQKSPVPLATNRPTLFRMRAYQKYEEWRENTQLRLMPVINGIRDNPNIASVLLHSAGSSELRRKDANGFCIHYEVFTSNSGEQEVYIRSIRCGS